MSRARASRWKAVEEKAYSIFAIKPYESMYPSSIYFGLKVGPI